MLSNKIFNTLKNNSKSAIIKALNINGGQAFAQQQRFMMPYMRLAQFGSCGTGGSGGCGSGKCLTKFRDDITEDVMSPMPTVLAKPTLRTTKTREAYSEEYDRTHHC
jgi:hypothetical protein